jgi:hypothetical protein
MNVESSVILRITNISGSKVVFKVKTTQPAWYYVRPNQQIMDIGKSDEVTIIIVEEYSNRYLELAQTGGIENLEKHRFMIQAKVISDDDYNNMERMTASQKSDEYQKIWNSEPKDDRFSIKFKAVFNYSNTNDIKSSPNTNNYDANNDAKSNKEKRNVKSPPSENVLEEIVNLRSKLDEVVVYSVYLTAERDTIVSQLEDAKRELSTYKNDKSKSSIGIASGKRGDGEKKSTGIEQLAMLLIVAVISYLAGLYIR